MSSRLDFELHPDGVAAAQMAASLQLAEWGLRSGHASLWVHRAAQMLAEGSQASAVLEYDREFSLLSFEVRQGGKIVYGIDDVV